MADRDSLIADFLSRTAWAGARRAPLAGDASNRRYERLTDPATGRTAVLMDAPPVKGEDVRPFVRIAQFLRGAGLSAPEIFAEDTVYGFLLLEDLGDDLFARVLERRPDLENSLYEAGIDVLAALHAVDPPDLPSYDPALMSELAALAFDKYRSGVVGDANDGIRAEFVARFRQLLEHAATPERPVLIQRDYHAENLLWLPERSGPARVGLLDFQDAMLGHPAYDLVSLLQDARRDVPPAIETAMIDRFVTRTGADRAAFLPAYAVLGAQRNLRILGVFARLGMEHGKPHYVDLIPRVWRLLQHDLDHPALDPVATLLRAALPEPTPDNLQRLKRQ
ncbi:aminoglycoside phosphotransferase family protein [Jhaorihella thermophila]|uniref:Aminoglycoside phosphotransferase domain-containing protein n=1 Tax=Jhaorihella thermophila TaxID=488547 RepID=A0A1H5VQT8_9RHOB|nr:phosphotransferase [Jhaorihella thermophila]SEF89679.1 hypothetical protein SAMN05421751_106185 [Jhaorihella thermophila]